MIIVSNNSLCVGEGVSTYISSRPCAKHFELSLARTWRSSEIIFIGNILITIISHSNSNGTWLLITLDDFITRQTMKSRRLYVLNIDSLRSTYLIVVTVFQCPSVN